MGTSLAEEARSGSRASLMTFSPACLAPTVTLGAKYLQKGPAMNPAYALFGSAKKTACMATEILLNAILRAQLTATPDTSPELETINIADRPRNCNFAPPSFLPPSLPSSPPPIFSLPVTLILREMTLDFLSTSKSDRHMIEQ